MVVVVVGGRPVTETDPQQQQLTARCTTALCLLHCTLALQPCTARTGALQRDCNLLESKHLAACSCTAPPQPSVPQQCTAAKKKKPNLAELWNHSTSSLQVCLYQWIGSTI